MKKRMRALMCLVLAFLLVGGMSVPAMADPAQGTGTAGEYSYKWSVTREDSSGRASISTVGKPTYLGAHVTNRIYCEECGIYGSTNSGDNGGFMEPVTGYAYVNAISNNVFTNESGTHTGTIWASYGSFWVNGDLVVAHALAT